jgi:hypothetical protein
VHLGYVMRSTYRFFLKRQGNYQIENIVIDFIRKAVVLKTERQVLEALAELKEQILTMINKPLIDASFEKYFLDNFPLIEWIDSKLQKRDFADIIRESYLQSLAAEAPAEEVEVMELS